MSGGAFSKYRPGSDGLAVLFPGAGYTVDQPLLSYADQIAQAHGMNVLRLTYFFQHTSASYETACLPRPVEEACATLLAHRAQGYGRLFFLSKSLGSLVAQGIAERLRVPVRHCFLTPLPAAMPTMLSAPCSVIVGTRDHFLRKEHLSI